MVCVYIVANCDKCDQNINKIDVTNLLVSCEFKDKWIWVFKSNSNSTQVSISTNITVNSDFVVDSNFSIDSSASVLITAANSSITVNGCVDVQGDLNVLIDFKLDQSQQFDLIKYNCTQIASVPKQINVLYNKNQNSCLKSNPKVTLNTISTTISSCGTNIGLIVGLSVGIPIAVILITILCLYIARKNMNKDIESFKEQQKNIEMEKMRKQDEDIWN